jgi:hypothetical protein
MLERTRTKFEFALAVTIMLVLTCVVGCGGRSDMGQVTGTVTYNGQPLRAAEVQFNPDAAGRNSVGYTDANGEYELLYTPSERGALVGKHNVSVVDRSGKTPIPAKFTSLKYEVKPGSSQFDIDITSE